MQAKHLFTLLLTILFLLQSSCFFKKELKQDPYKEGEVVTWSYGEQFIIKSKVGERRKHLVDTICPRCEREFYQPRFEHYLGQFPIDYQPEKFPTMTLEEANNTPRGNRRAGHPALEFNLMLNGSWVEATDRDVVSEDTLDHEDQVKIVVEFKRSKRTTKEGYLKSLKEEKGVYNQKFSEKYGLECRDEELGLSCFGKSANKNISGVIFSFWNNNKVKATYYEPMYGGIWVDWYINGKNLQHWQQVDAKVWQLLDSWNVSPVPSH